MNENNLMAIKDIQSRIYTFRGLQVMLDSDLAELYNVETKVLNQAVKRNSNRFPNDFMIQLSELDYNILRSQNVTLENTQNLKSQNVTSKDRRGLHRKYYPYVFTEQGVASLSGILKSKKAIEVNIHIIRAFVAMRRFISKNAEIFTRLDVVERKQLEYQIKTDNHFERVFNAIENKEIHPKQGIFFDGQIFDAYVFVSDLIRSAQKSIVLIDNFIDDSVLTLFSKRKENINVTIYTKNISKQLSLDLKKYNEQYPKIDIKEFEKSHDRFLIIDETEVYHIGASLKDLGKKWFAFSKFDKKAITLLDKLEK